MGYQLAPPSVLSQSWYVHEQMRRPRRVEHVRRDEGHARILAQVRLRQVFARHLRPRRPIVRGLVHHRVLTFDVGDAGIGRVDRGEPAIAALRCVDPGSGPIGTGDAVVLRAAIDAQGHGGVGRRRHRRAVELDRAESGAAIAPRHATGRSSRAHEDAAVIPRVEGTVGRDDKRVLVGVHRVSEGRAPVGIDVGQIRPGARGACGVAEHVQPTQVERGDIGRIDCHIEVVPILACPVVGRVG